MVKGPEIRFVISKVHQTERIYKGFVGQNSRDQTFGSLYREVRYIGGSLNRDSTVFPVLRLVNSICRSTYI